MVGGSQIHTVSLYPHKKVVLMSVPTNIVIEYLHRLLENHVAGVKETSNYPALAHLFNEAGKRLHVRCIIHPQNKGAGIPDGGFFTLSQLKVTLPGEPHVLPQTPERGAIAVKGTGENVLAVAKSAQVAKYVERYGQVLVTNCYDFLLVVQDGTEIQILERFRLAEDEAAFWQAAAQPQTLAMDKGEQLVEYLKRVMLHAAPLTRSQDVAWFLASYARDARIRIERAELAALIRVRKALEEALGMQFADRRGEHFFRSTLIQTLFYGIFSAWVLWSKTEGRRPGASFDWRVADWHLHIPMVSALFSQVVNRNQLAPLGLVEVLHWTGHTLNRIDRAAFFASFDEGQAVQYFYEPFLEAYDPELRKQLGVWYTPAEVIEYMVERVDQALRSELGIAHGLADPGVYVLDPCCGTGSYLVAVLRRIARTLEEQGGDALSMLDVKKAAIERVFGFEILPAPFVVAHLQMGLLLQQLGVPIADDKDERVAIYLTDALAGWESLDSEKECYIQTSLSGWPELREERDAAQHVKQQVPVLVVLGNPPYNAFAGTSPEEEGDLMQPYKQGLFKHWGIRKFNMEGELYLRFFRLAERRIAEQTGRGIVCYISNFSYLNDPSYVVMRQRFVREFDTLWFDCLNGDSRETGKLTPEGKPDPSIFSTKLNREGIRLGTAIGLMVRKGEQRRGSNVYFREFWGVNKRAELLASVNDSGTVHRYLPVLPARENRYAFRPSNATSHYLRWPGLNEFAHEASNGLMEKRAGALIDIDKRQLEHRMQMYYDPQVGWEKLVALQTGLTQAAAGYDPQRVRAKLLAAEKFQADRLCRYVVRPFDVRWCYYSGVSPLWNRSRPALWAQCWEGNRFVLSRMKGTASPEGVPLYLVQGLSDDHLLMTDAVCFPIHIRSGALEHRSGDLTRHPLFADDEARGRAVANLSVPARRYLADLGVADPDVESESAHLLWMHALAIGFAPLYLKENADGVRDGWPRIPLPAGVQQLHASAALGARLAALLNTEQPLKSAAQPILRGMATLTVTERGSTGLEANALLDLRAGWGYRSRGAVTMPGKGWHLERPYSEQELALFAAAGPDGEELLALLGRTTYDVYLNEHLYWKNIPARIWQYHIGGYQVIKKWLSYREHSVLGRPLTSDEAREVTGTARRIAGIVMLEPELNTSYGKTLEYVYRWPGA